MSLKFIINSIIQRAEVVILLKQNKSLKTVYYLAFIKPPEELQDISCLLLNAAVCIKNKKAPVKGNERGTVHVACSHPFSEHFFFEKLLCARP